MKTGKEVADYLRQVAILAEQVGAGGVEVQLSFVHPDNQHFLLDDLDNSTLRKADTEFFGPSYIQSGSYVGGLELVVWLDGEDAA